MKKFKTTTIAALALCGALGAAGTAQAGLVVTINESGSNLVMSYGAGTLDTTGLTNFGNFNGCGSLFTGLGVLIGGGADDLCSGFRGNIAVTQSSGWTLGSGQAAWSSIVGAGGLIASTNYGGGGPSIFIGNDQGAPIVGLNAISGVSGTVNGASFASTGLTAGQFIEFSWGTDSLRFTTVAANAVPEPTTLALVGLALAGVGLARRRRA